MATPAGGARRNTMGDPRVRADGLGWVSRAVFPDERLRLSVSLTGWGGVRGIADERPGHTVERYAVVPSLDAARFLLPLGSDRVTAASTLAYNALRPAGVRSGRAAIGWAARLGLTDLLRLPVLTVQVPATVDSAEVLLAYRIARLLGYERLYAAIGIRPPDPHHKPTLQLFDVRGRPAGYAKVGWNEATRAMTRAEAEALRHFPRTGGSSDLPDVPALLLADSYGGRDITVVEPMPLGVRRLRRPDVPRLAAIRALARRGGSPGPIQPLRGSVYRRRVAARTAAAGAWNGTGDVGGMSDAFERFLARFGDTMVEFGDWHGDWVPWNLGRYRGRLVAWDWENSGSDVPLGFDLAHQAFQTAWSQGRPVAQAADAMDACLARYGGGLGLGPAQRQVVADGYLFELWLRLVDLAAGGGGWNPRLRTAVPDLISSRLPAP